MGEGIPGGESSQEKVRALLQQGRTQAEIARELGVCRQAVAYHQRVIRLRQETEKPKTKKRTKPIEWSVYQEQRVIRGECLLDVELLAEESELLEQMNQGKKGKKFRYSDHLVELAFSLKVAFKISYAMLEGVLRKLLPLLGLTAPDYSTLCKRVAKLSSRIVIFGERAPSGEDAIDSTGRSQNLRGSYRESKYAIASRKFLKVSVQIDAQTLEAKALVVDEPQTADVKHLPELMRQARAQSKVTKVFADRAYDSAPERADLLEQHIEPVIRPRVYGDVKKIQKKLEALEKRSENGQQAEEGKKLLGKIHRWKAVLACAQSYEGWRDQTGYGRRAMVENFFSRDTLLFGDRVCSKDKQKARVEMVMRLNLLNAFITLRACATKSEAESVKGRVLERLRGRVPCTRQTPARAA